MSTSTPAICADEVARSFRKILGEMLNPDLDGGMNGRSGRIRTCDPRVPNAVLYQTEPHSDLEAAL